MSFKTFIGVTPIDFSFTDGIHTITAATVVASTFSFTSETGYPMVA